MELWEAYRRTTYVARTPEGELRLRIGRVEPGLDALLARTGAEAWAFVTAWNPGSRPTSPAVNAVRQAELAREVAARGWIALEGEGVGDDGAWPPEPSLLVLGPTREEARALGRRFGQNAVVWAERGGAPVLIDCR